MDQDSTWYGGRPRSRRHCVSWNTQLPHEKGYSNPHFLTHVYCGETARWIRIPLGTEVGLAPGDIALDGDPAPTFRLTLLWHGRPSQPLMRSCCRTVITDRPTDRPRYSIYRNRPHLASAAMRPNNGKFRSSMLTTMPWSQLGTLDAACDAQLTRSRSNSPTVQLRLTLPIPTDAATLSLSMLSVSLE